jgi:hypothetical protein
VYWPSLTEVGQRFTKRANGVRTTPVRLGVTAPLPTDFVQLCEAVGLPLSADEKEGGVFLDEKKVGTHHVSQLGGYFYG